MDFDTLYQDVPPAQRKALKRFRDQHAAKQLDIEGTQWTYYVIGQGHKSLLWLVGGLKRADAAYQSIPLLAETYRIIAPDYPALGSMDALADGLAAILVHEGVDDEALVLSGSFGGMLAQVLIRRHPNLIEKAVLSTTTAPNGDLIEGYQQLAAMTDAAPDALLAQSLQSQMLEMIRPPADEVAFYQAYLKELYEQRLNKADISSMTAAILDYMQREFTESDLLNWQGDLLLITSDDDTSFGENSANHLIDLYPQAQVQTFKGAGHSPASTRRDDFFNLVQEFLG